MNFFSGKAHLYKEIAELKWQIVLLEKKNSEYRRELSQKVIMNQCDNCLPEPVTGEDELLQDTGVCDQCGKVAEVIDLELIAYYRNIFGLNTDFISKHLPRLRKSRCRYLSLDDIFAELSQKTDVAEVLDSLRNDSGCILTLPSDKELWGHIVKNPRYKSVDLSEAP